MCNSNKRICGFKALTMECDIMGNRRKLETSVLLEVLALGLSTYTYDSGKEGKNVPSVVIEYY